MVITETRLKGAFVIELEPIEDLRGFFARAWSDREFEAAGLTARFVETNVSFNNRKGTLRGMHFQAPPHAQGKLVRCSRGAILDVGVDIRVGSPSYGGHVAVELSAANWRQLWLPPGFAHGYVTLVDDCEVIYKVTDYYAPECDRGIAWDDPILMINWRLSASEVILSEKDRRQSRLEDVAPAFQFGG